ncbi:MAG TPA: nucleotidyltransferase domain-containing protein [Blastocatellia bacterium]|nr:nucleotidyltransferase domain-containing protein [Blastocatellia bacterium]
MTTQIKLKSLNPQQIADLLPEGLILLGYRGSIAHNMYIPQRDPNSIDDKDIMGAFVAPIQHYLGFGRQEVKERFIGEWDAVSYEIRKFISLLLKCNPNVLSLLWVPERHIIYMHELGRYLRENKDIFVTKQAYHSFNGYAYGQFKRMTHLNQEARSQMDDYEKILDDAGLDPNNIHADQALRSQSAGSTLYAGLTIGDVITKYEALRRQYYSGGYMGAKRRELVRKVGYDAKNAAHLIRLLRMGIEFLVEGELHVERADAEQLLEIKRGEWPLERVKAEAERLFKLAEEAYVRSSLPPKPDSSKAEQLCLDIVSRYHGITPAGA